MANVKTYDGTGADCSGSSYDSNRVLTLSNTGTTRQSGFLVYVSGLALALTTEYTVSHKSSSSEITFLNPLTDTMTIVIQYYENISGVAGDFENGALADFGVTAVRTPVTVTTDFSGNKTYTDGTDEDIDIIFNPYKNKHNLDKAGLTKVYDVMMFIKPGIALNKYDKITYSSKVYRVENVSPRNFNGTAVFQVVGLFFLENE